MLSIHSNEYYMKKALQEAEIACEEGEVPVGAVVVCQGQIVARARNSTERLHDVTAHAEMLAITAAANYLNSKYLHECTIYVTLEPCLMCAGALFWAQVGRLVYGAADDKRGFMRVGKKLLHPKTSVEYGVMEAECRQMLRQFFQERRKRGGGGGNL